MVWNVASNVTREEIVAETRGTVANDPTKSKIVAIENVNIRFDQPSTSKTTLVKFTRSLNKAKARLEKMSMDIKRKMQMLEKRESMERTNQRSWYDRIYGSESESRSEEDAEDNAYEENQTVDYQNQKRRQRRSRKETV